jgi:hypothetical protein
MYSRNLSPILINFRAPTSNYAHPFHSTFLLNEHWTFVSRSPCLAVLLLYDSFPFVHVFQIVASLFHIVCPLKCSSRNLFLGLRPRVDCHCETVDLKDRSCGDRRAFPSKPEVHFLVARCYLGLYLLNYKLQSSTYVIPHRNWSSALDYVLEGFLSPMISNQEGLWAFIFRLLELPSRVHNVF